MLSLGRFRRIIGLDIGTCLIKAVEARKAGGRLEITNFGVCPTPQGVISNGRVMNPPEAANAVKEALNAGGVRGREVCAAVSGGEVIVRHVFFPRMPREELAQAVKWEAGAYIPYPVDEASIDFDVIGAAHDSPDKVEVMIVAAPNSLVESHVRTMELAGVRPLFLDIQPIAICRVFCDGKSEEAQFFVDIGGGTTDLVYSEQGVLRFTRIVNIGGNTLTEAIARTGGYDFVRAEELKRRASLRERDEGRDDTCLDSESMEALREVVRRLATEVRRSVDYCNAQARVRNGGHSPITRVVLTGGGSNLDGLGEYLEANLGLEVIIGDPLVNVTFSGNSHLADDLDTYGTSLAVAVGLLHRGVDG
jgi:type IV pilus assembly protein PilM